MNNQALTTYEEARDRWRSLYDGKRALAAPVSESPTLADDMAEMRHVISDLSERHHREIPEIQLVLADLSEKLHDGLISGNDRPRVIGTRDTADGGVEFKRAVVPPHQRPIGAKRTKDGWQLIFGEVS